MLLTMIASDCADGRTCPELYVTDRRTAVVRGYVVNDPEALDQMSLPEGETAVEVPLSLLRGTADDERV